MPSHKIVGRNDIYAALGPIDYTSEDMCICRSVAPIVLQDCLMPNPLYCGTCFGEVPPESIPLAVGLVRPIAQWRDIYRALYVLWIDSDDYAEWASDRLTDVAGHVHALGRGIAEQITMGGHPCYYRWFVPHPKTSPLDCPICGHSLVAWPGRSDMCCHLCRIVL